MRRWRASTRRSRGVGNEKREAGDEKRGTRRGTACRARVLRPPHTISSTRRTSARNPPWRVGAQRAAPKVRRTANPQCPVKPITACSANLDFEIRGFSTSGLNSVRGPKRGVFGTKAADLQKGARSALHRQIHATWLPPIHQLQNAITINRSFCP